MKNKIWAYAFIILVVMQLGFIGYIVIGEEKGMQTGAEYRFRTAPVDPYDAFRGKYVALGYEQREAATDTADLRVGEYVYGKLEVDKEGFARIKELSRKKQGECIKVQVIYSNSNNTRYEMPFTRYFMNEEDAPRAEKLYREANSRQIRNTYVKLKINNGQAVMEGLYVDGVKIEELVGKR